MRKLQGRGKSKKIRIKKSATNKKQNQAETSCSTPTLSCSKQEMLPGSKMMEPELVEEDERQNAANQSAGAANSLNSLFGLKTPQMELGETTKTQGVAMQTLEMV